MWARAGFLDRREQCQGPLSGSTAAKGDHGARRARRFVLADEAHALAALAGDQLSESESDDEDDAAPALTPAFARALFRDTGPSAEWPANSENARTRAIENMNRAARIEREKDTEILVDCMGTIGAKVTKRRSDRVAGTKPLNSLRHHGRRDRGELTRSSFLCFMWDARARVGLTEQSNTHKRAKRCVLCR